MIIGSIHRSFSRVKSCGEAGCLINVVQRHIVQFCGRTEQTTCVVQRTHSPTHPATQQPPSPRITHARTLRGALLPGIEEEGGGEAGATAWEQWATCGASKCVSTLLHLSARPLHIHFMSQSHPHQHPQAIASICTDHAQHI